MARVKAWHISDDGLGSGGFMSPPGHWNHRYTLWHGWSYKHADFIGSIDYDDEPLPEAIAARIAHIKASATLVCSEPWQRHVYLYFQHMYARESGNRVASMAITDHANALPPERHLGFLMVREFFPDHEPRLDLIMPSDIKGYGSYPCVHCGKRVQYDARIDGYEPLSGDKACTDGNAHSWEAR